MFDYFQKWEASSGFPVKVNTSTSPAQFEFKMSETLYCKCNSSQPFMGCEFNCSRTHLVLTATVVSVDDKMPFEPSFNPDVIEVLLQDTQDELEEPKWLYAERSPSGFLVALQSVEQRSTSAHSGKGLLSVSTRATLTVKAITSFHFAYINKYTPSSLNQIAEIDLTFSARFDLQGLEPITLYLPGFDGLEQNLFSEYLKGQDGTKFGAAWYPSNETLVFYLRCASSRIPAGRHLHLIFPNSLGVVLPIHGIDTNSTTVAISSPTSPSKVFFILIPLSLSF